MSMPAWEIPFNALGKVIEAVPLEIAKVAKDIGEANAIIDQDLPKIIGLLDDAAVVVNDKFLNIQLDVALGKEALALLASLKAQLGVKSAAAVPGAAA